jgi:AcrR family transcriptional regulator
MTVIDPLFAQTFAIQASKADRKRLAIIQAGVSEIARHGLTPATFGRIAAAIKTRPSHVSYYYKSREGLFLDVVKYCLAVAQSVTVGLLSPDVSPREGVRAIVQGAFRWSREHPEQARVFLLFHYQASIDARFSALSDEFRAAARARIQALLPGTRGKASGELAEAIHTHIMGLLFASLTAPKKAESARFQRLAEEQCVAWVPKA